MHSSWCGKQRARIAALGSAALALFVVIAAAGHHGAVAAPASPVPPAVAVSTGAASADSVENATHPLLLRAQSDVFLVQDRHRRWVSSPQVFTDYRFRAEWVEQVTDSELTAIPRAANLVAGPVLRAPDGTLWVVFQGTRRRVAGRDAWAPLYLSADDAVPATDAQVQSYSIGRPIGNPPRPWMAGVVALACVWGASLVWWNTAATRPRLALVAVGALAVVMTALRLYYVALYPWQPDGPDAAAYVSAAHYLGSGGSILRDDPKGELIAVTSPGYPMILALLSGAVALAHGSVVGWKVVQAGAATLLAAVVADLARCLYGPRVGFAAAVLALLSPLWLYSAELLQYELWYALLVATALWALVHLGRVQRATCKVQREEGGELHHISGLAAARHHPAFWLIVSGLCYGLAMVIQLKSLILLFPAFVFLAKSKVHESRYRGARGKASTLHVALGTLHSPARWAGPALFLVLSLAPLAAWGARNVALHGEPLLGSTGGGTLLWMGNHDSADGGYVQVPRPAAFYERVQRYPQASVTREARAFIDLAMEYIVAHPSQVALLALTKLERFWWTITPDRLGEFAEARMLAFLGGVDSATLRVAAKLLQYTGIALAGAGLLWGGRLVATIEAMPPRPARSARLLVITSIVAFWLVHSPFIVEPRYRIPVAPLVQVLEAAGLVLLVERLRSLPLPARGETQMVDGDEASDERYEPNG